MPKSKTKEVSRASVVTGNEGRIKDGVSYAQAALSPVSEDRVVPPRSSSNSRPQRDKEWVVVKRGGSIRKQKGFGRGQSSSGSSSSATASVRSSSHLLSKRRRSPESRSQPCSRCFRDGHRADECHHLIVCLRCSRAGHTASACHVPPRAKASQSTRRNGHDDLPRPRRGALPSDLKRRGDRDSQGLGVALESSTSCRRQVPEPPMTSLPGKAPVSPLPRRNVRVSIPLSLDIIRVKQELSSVVVASFLSGFVSTDRLLEIIAAELSVQTIGSASNFCGGSLLIMCSGEEMLKKVIKLSDLKCSTAYGLCTVRLRRWSSEVGSSGRAIGRTDWVHIWNMLLHCWGWNAVSDLLKTFGEVVTMRQHADEPSSALSALARLRPSVELPMLVELSVGMR